MLEGGFDAVRHRAVATRADLPLASTTYYFDSLDDLIACAVELNGNADMEAMRARVAAVTQRRRGAESTVELWSSCCSETKRSGRRAAND